MVVHWWRICLPYIFLSFSFNINFPKSYYSHSYLPPSLKSQRKQWHLSFQYKFSTCGFNPISFSHFQGLILIIFCLYFLCFHFPFYWNIMTYSKAYNSIVSVQLYIFTYVYSCNQHIIHIYTHTLYIWVYVSTVSTTSSQLLLLTTVLTSITIDCFTRFIISDKWSHC